MDRDIEEWRLPADEFAEQLSAARVALLAAQVDPWPAVELFEPIIEMLRYDRPNRESRLPRVRSLGLELSAELCGVSEPVAMEVRHYCWYLEHLDVVTSLTDMMMLTLTRFAHFSGHVPENCEVCAQFPGDLPFQGSPHGQAHFEEWLQSRGG